MDRRSLLDADEDAMGTPRREMVDIFDDEFEVEDFDVVADGMRNSDHDREEGGEMGARSGSQDTEPVRSVAAYYAPLSPVDADEGARRGMVRNSMRKSRGVAAAENPFSSPQDDETPAERMPTLSYEPDTAHRSVSSASSRHFARTSSPRLGAGPSHPYALYPQGTIPRSSSVATSSTVRPAQRQSSMQTGPQHPYSLYPQGVTEDVDDEDHHAPQNLVPVGFSGLGQSYRRQLGPDGEEQDLIGEDGHAEPLPPYTRYPEDGPEKMPLLVPAAPGALHSRAPVAGTDPGMPLMHTALEPQQAPAPASMSDESTLLRQTSRVGSVHSPTISTTKRSWSEKSWKEKRRTRVCCGVPFWWILLGLGVLGFIGAMLGGVIGGWVLNDHVHHWGGKPTSTSLYDASAIAATPTVSPPTGTFALSLSTPQQTQAQCLPQASQQAAWSCDLVGEPAMVLNVESVSGGDQTGANVFFGSNNTQICYGAQVSYMSTKLSPFLAVVDNDLPNNGPAFYFQSFYDKVVVVPETALSVTAGKQKRQGYFSLEQGWLQQKQVAPAGAKPWFCVWNNTFLEGFVYVQQPVPQTFFNTTASASAAAATNSTTAPSSTTTAVNSPKPTAPPFSASGPPTGPMLTTTYTNPSTTAVFTGPASQYPAWSAGMDHAGTHNKRQQTTTTSSSTPDGDLYDSLPLYPYVVKLEERRLTGNTVQPYCQQMQILDDGSAGIVKGADGQPANVIYLTEQDPAYSAYQSAGLAGSRRRDVGFVERRGVKGGCHCQWMSGQQ